MTLLFNDVCLKLLLSIICGGIVGAERELRSKSAGLRTLMMICLGACIFTICSQVIGAPGNPDRIASNIVTGIGFVGAGVIYKADIGLNGITTAATIWMTASIGMLIGGGFYEIAGFATAMVIVILFLLTFLERWMDTLNHIRIYKMTYPYAVYKNHSVKEILNRYHLSLKTENYRKDGAIIEGTWRVQGSEKNHQLFIDHILDDLEIQDFEF